MRARDRPPRKCRHMPSLFARPTVRVQTAAGKSGSLVDPQRGLPASIASFSPCGACVPVGRGDIEPNVRENRVFEDAKTERQRHSEGKPCLGPPLTWQRAGPASGDTGRTTYSH